MALDATTSSNAKLAAMVAYFQAAPPEDAAWAAYFLAGGKPRQLVPSKVMRDFAQRSAQIPEWLFDESYQAVGDLAETIALLSPQPAGANAGGLALWMEQKLLPLRGLPPEDLLTRLDTSWRELDTPGRFICAKLMTGAFRVGVSKLLVTRALATVAGIDAKRIAERMVGYTDLRARPDAAGFAALVAPESAGGQARDGAQPYPFFLAHSLQSPVEDFEAQIGPVSNWMVEWKWDGIRAQIVRRGGSAWVWSRGEELVTERFPELAQLGARLPEGTVLDGEIVVWQDDRVQPFAKLQQRIGRKTLPAKLLADTPVVLLAYDLLEWQGTDLRQRPQAERRALLEKFFAGFGADYPGAALQLSPLLEADDWQHLAVQREASRSLGVEGMMLKHRQAHYGVGRTKDVGTWWKWKIDPHSIDAVLIYAQQGHGRRAGLYTDYTFAVWDAPPQAPERKLVPFAKAYSGLTDEEMGKVDAIIRRTTTEKFGPVRSVTPSMVFELGFEGIAKSPRHKSGIAVRFPRMLRWRHDKKVEEADTLETLSALLPG
ncbi:MAG: lig2 [Betaproteobacteria bacterium]|nr:lig2 [Betaproteobacteria bacterium]